MIRRSFRAGLTLGVLTGLAFALVKMLGARTQQAAVVPAADEPWPRLQPDPVPTVPAPVVQPAPRAAPDPVPAPTPEPVPTPTPTEVAPPAPPVAEPTAAKPAAAKPVAAKKASTTTKKKKAPVAPWVEATDGVCPTSHPVKGKLASKIFHLPGMLNYDRTRADRCYRDVTAAEKDGLRPAKR